MGAAGPVRSRSRSRHPVGPSGPAPQTKHQGVFCVKLDLQFQFSRSAVSDSLQLHGLQHTPGFPVYHQLPELIQTHVH